MTHNRSVRGLVNKSDLSGPLKPLQGPGGCKKFTSSLHISSSHTSVNMPIHHFLSYMQASYSCRRGIGGIELTSPKLEVNFLHPSGPCKGFKWPKRSDLLTIPLTDLLCVIDPHVTRNGQTYALSDKDLKNIDLAYTAFMKNIPYVVYFNLFLIFLCFRMISKLDSSQYVL